MCKNSNFTEFKIPTGHLFSKYKSHRKNLQFVFTRDKILKKMNVYYRVTCFIVWK